MLACNIYSSRYCNEFWKANHRAHLRSSSYVVDEQLFFCLCVYVCVCVFPHLTRPLSLSLSLSLSIIQSYLCTVPVVCIRLCCSSKCFIKFTCRRYCIQMGDRTCHTNQGISTISWCYIITRSYCCSHYDWFTQQQQQQHYYYYYYYYY